MVVPPIQEWGVSYNTLFCSVNRAFLFSTGPRYNPQTFGARARRGKRDGNPISPRRAFLARPAHHAPRCVALADFFSILLDVMARFDRDGQAGPAQPGDIESRYAV